MNSTMESFSILFADGELGWIILFVCVFFACAAIVGIVKWQDRETAKREYQESLDSLKNDPHNPDLREKTLSLGRKYASLSRDSKGVALFDEVMLMNDINAACARAGSKVEISQSAPVASAASTEDRLTKLQDLLSGGFISTEEYTSRRQQILSEI